MFEEIFNQPAKWYKKIGDDVFGKPQYAEPVNLSCMFRGGMRLIKDKTGKDVISQGYFKMVEKIGLEDIIEYEKQQYIMLNYKDIVDVDGTYTFRKVWV